MRLEKIFNSARHITIYILMISVFAALFCTMMADGVPSQWRDRDELVIDNNALNEGLKDFRTDDTCIISESIDPWINITNGIAGRYDELIIDVDYISTERSDIQIFYDTYTTEGYSEERSFRAILQEGENRFKLPSEELDGLRLDLTNQKDVAIKLSRVSLLTLLDSLSPASIALLFTAFIAAVIAAFFISLLLDKKADAIRFSIKNVVNQVEKHPLIALMTIVIATFIASYFDFLFGARAMAYLDIGSDTVFNNLRGFQNVVNDLRNGDTAAWSFIYGVGEADFGPSLDIFMWPTYIAGILFGLRGITISLPWTQLLRTICASLLCYCYLSEFHFKKLNKIIASYIFSFCGYLVLWGQHYSFASAFVMATAVILLIEKSVKCTSLSKNHLLLILATAYLAICYYYFTYMTLVLGAVYTIIRLISHFGFKAIGSWMKSGIMLLSSVILGLVLSGAWFLPQAAYVLSVSDRITGGSGSVQYPLFYGADRAATILLRFFSNNLQGINNFSGAVGTNYYEAEQLFFSSFFPAIVIIYIALGAKKGSKEFARRLALSIALVVLPFAPYTGLVFNSFVYPMGRYTFTIMLFYAYVTCEALEDISENGISPAVITVIAAIYCSVMAFIPIDNRLRVYFVIIVVELLAFLISISRYGDKNRKGIAIIGTVCVLMANIAGETWISANHRTSLTDLYSYADMENSTAIVKQIKSELQNSDGGFFRMEKSYTDYTWLNDSVVEEYSGINTYNATHNGNVKSFYRSCWDAVAWPIKTYGYISFAQDYMNTKMGALLGVKYLVSLSEIENPGDYELVGVISGRYVYRNTLCSGFGRFYSAAVSYDQLGNMTEEERQNILSEQVVLEHSSADSGATGTVTMQVPHRDDRLTVSVNATGDGFVFLPIPYQNGWTASVNSEKADILRADYGFMAIPVQEGNSIIAMEYNIPFVTEGIVMTSVGMMAFVILSIFVIMRNKNKHNKMASEV